MPLLFFFFSTLECHDNFPYCQVSKKVVLPLKYLITVKPLTLDCMETYLDLVILLARFVASFGIPDRLLLDRSPNIGPLIIRWEIEKFKNCWNKSFRTSRILALLYLQFSNMLISQRDMSGPRLGALSNNRWSKVVQSLHEVQKLQKVQNLHEVQRLMRSKVRSFDGNAVYDNVNQTFNLFILKTLCFLNGCLIIASNLIVSLLSSAIHSCLDLNACSGLAVIRYNMLSIAYRSLW